MKTITIDILRVAFRKLLTATYYDKTDLVMRYRVATFARNLSSEEEERRIKAIHTTKQKHGKCLFLSKSDNFFLTITKIRYQFW